MITFISLWEVHTIPKSPPPKHLNTIKLFIIEEGFKIGLKRIIPYPPSFSKIPAKIIDPPTGASTWAFGSHWWTKNIGNLTKKAKINVKLNIFFIKKFGFKKHK